MSAPAYEFQKHGLPYLRIVRDREPTVAPLHHPRMADLMKDMHRRRMSQAVDTSQWKAVGEGSYGVAYRATVTPSVMSLLRGLKKNGWFRVFESFPEAGREVIIKVQDMNGRQPSDIMDAVHETLVHAQATRTCTPSGVACSQKKDCLSDFVPRFHLSAFIPRGKTFVTVMGVAPGITVYTATNQETHVPLDLYVRVERAMALLWAAGIVHTDSHTNNMMWDQRTQRLSIIDFGLAMLLPDDVIRKIAPALSSMIMKGAQSLGDVWDVKGIWGTARLHNYMNARHRAMSLYTKWYTSDALAVQYLYTKLSASDKLKLPDARRALWRCQAPARSPALRAGRMSVPQLAARRVLMQQATQRLRRARRRQVLTRR